MRELPTHQVLQREADIMRLLACPSCRRQLSMTTASASCPSCRQEFRRRGAAWDLMPPGVERVGSEAKKAPRRGWKHRLRPPNPSLNVNRSRLLQLVQHASANGPVLDLRSGARRLGERVINFDLDLFANVDVIGSPDALPFVNAGLGLVVCQAVLELLTDQAVRCMCRSRYYGGVWPDPYCTMTTDDRRANRVFLPRRPQAAGWRLLTAGRL